MSTHFSHLAATTLLNEMVTQYLADNPATPAAKLEKLRNDFWTRWTELKSEIDMGLASLHRDGGKELNDDLLTNVKRRGRERLEATKAE